MRLRHLAVGTAVAVATALCVPAAASAAAGAATGGSVPWQQYRTAPWTDPPGAVS